MGRSGAAQSPSLAMSRPTCTGGRASGASTVRSASARAGAVGHDRGAGARRHHAPAGHPGPAIASAPERAAAAGGQAWGARHGAAALGRAGQPQRRVATPGVASVLGFVYWALAARLFSQRAVGYGSAGISAMTLLGTI